MAVLTGIELLNQKAVLEYQPRHPSDMLSTWADIQKAKDLLRVLQQGFWKANYTTGIREAFRQGIRLGISGDSVQVKPLFYLRLGREEAGPFVRHILDLIMK